MVSSFAPVKFTGSAANRSMIVRSAVPQLRAARSTGPLAKQGYGMIMTRSKDRWRPRQVSLSLGSVR